MGKRATKRRPSSPAVKAADKPAIADVTRDVQHAIEALLATECGPLNLLNDDGTTRAPDSDRLENRLGELLCAARIEQWQRHVLGMLAALLVSNAPAESHRGLSGTAISIARAAENTTITIQLDNEEHADAAKAARSLSRDERRAVLDRAVATERAFMRRFAAQWGPRATSDDDESEAA